MSGLLDKANETAKANADTKENDTSEDDDIFVPLMEKSDSATFSNGLDTSKLKFQLSSVIGFLLVMILVFFVDNTVLFSGYTLDDFLVPGIILCWAAFNGKELISKEFDTKMLVASGVAFIVLTGLFAGVAMFSSNDSGVSIANIEYDGEYNEIDLTLYGPKGMDYTIEVLVDGAVEYSHEATISTDKGRHSVSLDDFWNGNAEDMNGDTLVDYEIKVTSDGGENSMTFDSIMNREVDTAFVKVTEVFETNDEVKTYTGITVEMIVGMGNPDSDYQFSADYFSGTTPQPIASDWTIDVVVKFGSSVKYEYDSFTADEGIVPGSQGEFRFDWVVLPGTSAGDLDRSDFYQADGCYTFEVTIENENGETYVDSSSKIEFFWDSNEANSDPDNHQPAEAC